MAKQLWIMDPSRSEITFKVRYMLIINVTVTFEQSTGMMHTDAPDFTDAEIRIDAEVTSVNTRIQQREHL